MVFVGRVFNKGCAQLYYEFESGEEIFELMDEKKKQAHGFLSAFDCTELKDG